MFPPMTVHLAALVAEIQVFERTDVLKLYGYNRSPGKGYKNTWANVNINECICVLYSLNFSNMVINSCHGNTLIKTGIIQDASPE